MEIKLYINSSESNKLNKAITEMGSIDGSILNAVSILTPLIRIRNTSYIKNVNYVYIPSFQRYYYVTDYKHDTNQTVILSLKVDVLMSHKEDILSTSQVVDRQENNYNLYLNDSMYKVYNKDRVQIKKLEGCELTKNMTNLLVVTGGAE